jgi:hypothetical protein
MHTARPEDPAIDADSSLTGGDAVTLITLFAIKPRRRVLRTGHLFCPTCRRRTPGDMFVVEDVFYLLGFLPAAQVGESANFLACRLCGDEFAEAGDWAFDFGDHKEPRTWECRSCGGRNTSEQFHCTRCGKHV